MYFLTIPYQTRVLGPEVFGLVGFAMALAVYSRIIVDFGFIISATEQVSLNRDDKSKVSSILSTTMYAKLWLSLISAAILLVLCLTIPVFGEHWLLFTLFFLASVVKSFLPDFVYRGIEKMKAITVRTVIIQTFFLIFLFVLVKKPEDYLWIPILELAGSVVALAFAMGHMKSIGYRLKVVGAREILLAVKGSLWFFYSRIAANIYTATNIFVLGMVYGAASQAVGLFTAADRLVSAGKQVIVPMGDALYPHMVRKKDFRLMKFALIYGTGAMAAGCAIVAIYANDISAAIFGLEYYAAGDYLRVLTVAIFFATPAILLGFPTLSPMGLAKHANISNIIGATLQMAQIGLLLATGELTVMAVCIATCVTEFVAMSYRAGVVFKYRDRLRVIDAN